MKNNLINCMVLSILLGLWGIKSNAQITLEHKYLSPPGEVNNFYVTDLGNNNFKYVMWDYFNCNFSLFNLNNTPYMLNIPIPICDSGNFYQLGYITNTLFDCDSTNIEYALIGHSASPTKKFVVYRTDGTLIFSKDSVTTLWCVGCLGGSKVINGIENTPAGTKLFLFGYNSNQIVNYIFSLCGTLPEDIKEIFRTNSYVKVFPNPASHNINFEITSPSNMMEYELTIFNSEFQNIKSFEINGIKSQLNIETESMSAGAYFYSLQNKNKIFQTGKFILIK